MKQWLLLLGFFGTVLVGLSAIRTVWKVRSIEQQSYSVAASPQMKPLAVVVPHHNIVKEKRRELLRQLSSQSQPKTILLLSPNHFEGGRKPVVTADYVWQLQGGEEHMEPDSSLIQCLLENQDVENDVTVVRNDHGITNLVGDIHEFFPKARIVPILLRDTITPIEVDRLVKNTQEVCKGKCGVIASVDMSHYQPARAADMHDVKTIRVLEASDIESIWSAEVDSRASLAFLVEWAQHFSLARFNLFAHTNSGIVAGNFESETTTHIFGYYESGTPRVADSGSTFTIAGSVSRCPLNQSSQIQFSDFGARALWGTDMSWAFWDSPLGESSFRDQLMREWHWSTLSMQVGTAVDGVYVQKSAVGGDRVAFISAEANNTALETTIQQEKSAGRFVGVFPRWQGKYSFGHIEEQRKKSVSWVRAGADIIAGFHEEGLQDMEIIDGTPVFYSVGGFLNGCGRVTQGLVINGVIEGKKLRVTFDPVRAEGFDTRLVSREDRTQTFQHLCSSEKIVGCLDGYIELQHAQ